MKLSDEKVKSAKEKQFEKMIWIQKTIKKYVKGEDWQTNEDENSKEYPITAQDIIMNPFVFSFDYKDHFEEQS